MGCGRVNVLMAMANCDTFTLRFFALLSFWSETHPVPYRPRTQFWLKKEISRSVEAFRQTDVKTNVYKRMLRSRLPWQLDLFSSQTKTFVSEITGRIRAWKQADSCSEDLPLAIQIGQCLLLVGFNGKFAFFTVGRCTTCPNCISGSQQGLWSCVYSWPIVQIIRFGVFRRNFALVLVFSHKQTAMCSRQWKQLKYTMLNILHPPRHGAWPSPVFDLH